MEIRRRLPKKARIEIIPMIDTIFFLLVFFMMATLTMTQMKAIKLNLPPANSATTQQVSKVIVSVSKDGKYYVDKTECGCGDIGQHLSPLIQNNPNIIVVLQGDEGSNYGDVIKALDELKKAGITKISIATK